jgi:hypothetical protein
MYPSTAHRSLTMGAFERRYPPFLDFGKPALASSSSVTSVAPREHQMSVFV